MQYEIIQKRCLHFFGRDYRLEVDYLNCSFFPSIKTNTPKLVIFFVLQIIDNKQGQLCGHYPSEIIIAVGHLNTEHNNNDDP